MEENARAYAENGHNRASLCKKTQNPKTRPRIVIYIQTRPKPSKPSPR